MAEPELYFEEASRYLNEALMEETLRALSPVRREKALKMKLQSAKRLSVAAGHLMDTVLARKGINPERVIYGKYGRPELPGNLLYFSLSHQNGTAALAVSEKPVGVDIEFVQDKKYSDSIVRRFYFPAEKEALSRTADFDAKLRLFFRMWTVKEAYGKLCGTGIKDALKMDSVNPFKSVCFSYPSCPMGKDYLVTVCMPQEA
ncbi:MAG: 4'-phosphopantetheinyl transferase superfamily protein [Lachnospiraceae bacterium]|nr:4'-phosphopantetheinyl transferase superfamily protein [Lachnospiraceae bacterium]